jgi:2-keto-4-pentenoate hydratase/2-oxohepta-3-ene-1,7-dioic acid hydratase in catechol pathway
MKFVTFDANGQERLGVVDAKRGILDLQKASSALPGSMIAFIEAGPKALEEAKKVVSAAQDKPGWLPLQGTKLHAPIPHPRKNIFCIGRNYKAHIEEGARARNIPVKFPPVPEIFSKPFTTVIGPEDSVKRHAKNTTQLDYEVELAIVIGKIATDVSAAQAMDHIFGYTIFNDVTARDKQAAHGQWFKGKSFDTFGPMGPCVVTKDEFGDPSGHRITLRVNGETRQDSNTSDLLFNVPAIVESVCSSLTLHPGDVIATGTPSGVALGMTPQKFLNVGDVIEAEVEGIGVLRNRVVE